MKEISILQDKEVRDLEKEVENWKNLDSDTVEIDLFYKGIDVS